MSTEQQKEEDAATQGGNDDAAAANSGAHIDDPEAEFFPRQVAAVQMEVVFSEASAGGLRDHVVFPDGEVGDDDNNDSKTRKMRHWVPPVAVTMFRPGVSRISAAEYAAMQERVVPGLLEVLQGLWEALFALQPRINSASVFKTMKLRVNEATGVQLFPVIAFDPVRETEFRKLGMEPYKFAGRMFDLEDVIPWNFFESAECRAAAEAMEPAVEIEYIACVQAIMSITRDLLLYCAVLADVSGVLLIVDPSGIPEEGSAAVVRDRVIVCKEASLASGKYQAELLHTYSPQHIAAYLTMHRAYVRSSSSSSYSSEKGDDDDEDGTGTAGAATMYPAEVQARLERAVAEHVAKASSATIDDVKIQELPPDDVEYQLLQLEPDLVLMDMRAELEKAQADGVPVYRLADCFTDLTLTTAWEYLRAAAGEDMHAVRQFVVHAEHIAPPRDAIDDIASGKVVWRYSRPLPDPVGGEWKLRFDFDEYISEAVHMAADVEAPTALPAPRAATVRHAINAFQRTLHFKRAYEAMLLLAGFRACVEYVPPVADGPHQYGTFEVRSKVVREAAARIYRTDYVMIRSNEPGLRKRVMSPLTRGLDALDKLATEEGMLETVQAARAAGANGISNESSNDNGGGNKRVSLPAPLMHFGKLLRYAMLVGARLQQVQHTVMREVAEQLKPGGKYYKSDEDRQREREAAVAKAKAQAMQVSSEPLVPNVADVLRRAGFDEVAGAVEGNEKKKEEEGHEDQE
jgi:hypothetical protein